MAKFPNLFAVHAKVSSFIVYYNINTHLTPCVGWYAPPADSVASARKFEITDFPL